MEKGHSVFEENFNYEKYALNLSDKAEWVLNKEENLIVFNFSDENKHRIINEVNRYCIIIAERLLADKETEYKLIQAKDIISFVVQWVFYKYIDMLQGEINLTESDRIISRIVDKLYDIVRTAVLNNVKNGILDNILPIEVKNIYDIELKKLLDENKITKEHYIWALNRSAYTDIFLNSGGDNTAACIVNKEEYIINIPLGERNLRIIALSFLLKSLPLKYRNNIVSILTEYDKKWICYYMSVNDIHKFFKKRLLIKLLRELYLTIKLPEKVRKKETLIQASGVIFFIFMSLKPIQFAVEHNIIILALIIVIIEVLWIIELLLENFSVFCLAWIINNL